jgi:hypothetical protein
MGVAPGRRVYQFFRCERSVLPGETRKSDESAGFYGTVITVLQDEDAAKATH